jgi:bacterial/archaeal transporter family-2 protein
MNATWIIRFIYLGGALQTCGATRNGQLYKFMLNLWLASTVSFAVIAFFFTVPFMALPHPLPTLARLRAMPWWAAD